MSGLDQGLLLGYLGLTLLLGLGLGRRRSRGPDDEGYLLAGRSLTLPAFVATTVSTWYGGILGVGEYSYRFGISNWLVFGVPYYLAAALFAFFLAERARRAPVLTLPEQVERRYGRGPAALAASLVLLTTLPAAYLLSLGLLLKTSFGLSLPWGVALAALFSVVYVWSGGFRSVLRTDLLQFVLMFGGFALLLAVLVGRHGFWAFLQGHLPPSHFEWHGGNAPQAIFVWYFIALGTLVEPSFYQRCFAARSPAVARRGLLLSIGAWALFDALTTFSGLYARALLPELGDAQAAEAFPRLAALTLPPGLLGLFTISLFATVMSTVDSYLFLAASTLGRDLLGRGRGAPASQDPSPAAGKLTTRTRQGLVLAALAAAGLALASPSVVSLWHDLGTVGTCTLLVPVLGAFIPRLRMSPRGATAAMLAGLLVSLTWLARARWAPEQGFPLGLEPIYPGLGAASLIWLLDWLRGQRVAG